LCHMPSRHGHCSTLDRGHFYFGQLGHYHFGGTVKFTRQGS
jgi:hypothetical protein